MPDSVISSEPPAQPRSIETERHPETLRIEIAPPQDGNLPVTLHGRLDLQTLPIAMDQLIGPLKLQRPAHATLDAAELTYCDGIGLGVLAEARRVLNGWGGQLQLVNLRPELQPLISLAALSDTAPLAPVEVPQHRSITIAAGTYGVEVYDAAKETVGFLGHLAAAIVWTFSNPRHIRLRDLLVTADKVGTDALPVVCLLGFLIGNILAFQAAPPVERLGGRDIIPTLVSISIVRELGPLIACILLAGRTGSAFAAELGTMTVTDEVSALTAMGLDPVRFLAVPRALAAGAVAPVLALFCTVTGILGGYCIMSTYGFTFAHYVVQVRQAVTYGDLLGGEFKTIVFGLIVGGVGCLKGLRTGAGPGAVGDSATRAVVASIVLIIIADGAFGVAYFYLGF